MVNMAIEDKRQIINKSNMRSYFRNMWTSKWSKKEDKDKEK